MKTKLIITIVVYFAIFVSCKNGKDKLLKADEVTLSEIKQLEPPKQNAEQKNEQQIPVGTLQQASMDSSAPPAPVKPVANPDWDKKIIKTATLKLEVKDFKACNNTVHQTVKQFGGYIAQEEQNLTDEKSETVISIKVPVDQFENMMNQLPGADVKIIEKKITTEDVTGEVVDTKSRLEAKKQMRLKYMDFLKQSKNMEEVLQVQKEINDIQEEIESAAGRVEFLSHQSSYSTINLTFYQPLPGYKPTNETPSFFTRISAAFKAGTSWIADLFVGLITLWPLIVLVAAVYIGWRKIKKTPKTITNTPAG